MSEEKHTPGPWSASQTYPTGDYCIHARGIPWQLAYLAEHKEIKWPLEANAKVIAAAPEMLDALRVSVAMVRDFLKDPTQHQDHILEMLNGHELIIAKAENRPLPSTNETKP